MAIKIITRENFDTEVLQASEPVLLDFWASWCGPCRMLSPVIDALAEKMPDVKVGKVNVDEQQELAQRFGIFSIPTLVVLKSGKVTAMKSGVQPEEGIRAMLGQ